MHSIAIIIPYFGKWPSWFHLYIESCRHNGSIDWLFFTDCPPPANAPGNMRFIPMTLAQFNQRASTKLDLPIDIQRPYKLCDLKPALGVIFDEYIKGYDFWGWGDTDVVYGNIRMFLNTRRLTRYDVISLKRYGTTGVLTLLRNDDEINRAYESSPDYRKVFTTGVGFAFDEVGRFRDRRVFSMTDVIRSMQRAGKIRALFWEPIREDRQAGGSFSYYWKDGALYDLHLGCPILLYHFLHRKKQPEFASPGCFDASKGLLISERGFQPTIETLTVRPKPALLPKLALDAARWAKSRIQQEVERYT